jgi:glycosyltransferase involved in cell wall biosynthesis
MRILLVLGMSAGGVGTHVRGLAAGLVADGQDVVVAGPGEALATFDLVGTGAAVREIRIAERPDPRRDTAAVAALRSLADRVDVVHAHGLRAGALACLATVRSRVPVVVTLHNAAPSGRLTSLVYAALERLVARRATIVLGVSGDLVERMRSLGARHTGLAVVPAPPPPTVTRGAEQVRTDLAVPHGIWLVVSVGRLTAQKDFPLLLQAVARLRDLPLRVVIAGDGPDRATLTESIDRQGLPVHILGRRSDVPDLLAAADVVVSSAVWEGQPVWLQEALLVGAPTVATDVGGTRDTLHGAGLLVPGGDPAALARGIRTVLTDPVEKARQQALSRSAAA